jgi:hypothetical protein
MIYIQDKGRIVFMKKILFILVGLSLISACASIQTNQQENVVKQEENQQTKISLKELEKQVKQRFAEIPSEELEKIEKDANSQKEIKEFKESLSKYSDREFSLQDAALIAAAVAAGYTDSEIFEYLDPSLVIKNPYCEDEFKFFKVFQTLPNMVLVSGCTKMLEDHCYSLSSRDFVTYKRDDVLYFDNKILQPNKDECPVYIGVYQYESRNGHTHVVPILSFEGKKITKMRLEEILKIREETAKEIK